MDSSYEIGGYFDNAIATLCGSTIPSPIRSTGSDMTLVFRSDAYVTHRGFEARITFTGGIV